MLLFLFACVSEKSADGPGGVADTSGVSDSASTADTDTGIPVADYNGTPPESPIPVPTFTARNMDGETRTQADLVGHPTVIWFYPAAGTSG
jgi:cytochrome oxidase Cu insertion factor (SCO1/SenC/PrrC family)